MSDRITRRFAQLSAAGRKALIPFITAGDPSPDWSVAMMHRLVEEGADLLELGVPFSDPTADGPVIQAASERAIGRGVTLAGVVEMVGAFRAGDDETPVVLMGYLNPLERLGFAQFCDAASQAGVDGLLIVDCPPEEMGRLKPHMDKTGLVPIYLVAPTTTPARKKMIAGFADGFIYFVSFKGITGADRLDARTLAAPLSELRGVTDLPLVVGFGIKDAEGAASVAACADGVVIGSALVSLLAGADDESAALELISRFLAPIRRAMDNVGAEAADQAVP